MCLHTHPVRETDIVRAPPLGEGDVLVYDEPGRCKPLVNGTGSTDYHSHHFRLVECRRSYALLVRHGAGDERIDLGGRHTRLGELLAPMDSDARFLMLHALFSAHTDAYRSGRAAERTRWMGAAAERRIRTRKMPGREVVKVWITDRA
jgi:hypothetical protein